MMKTKYNNIPLKSLAAVSLALGLSVSSQAQVSVDTELLLLVDVSGSVDGTEYDLMMDGYSAAFRDVSVVSAIQTGSVGSIGISLVFWSGAAQQAYGVGWTEISDLTSSQAFADAIDATTRPYTNQTAIGSALSYGVSTFGTETGNIDNGFSSISQIIDISGDGTDNNTPGGVSGLTDARNAALVAGVDMINGLPIGNITNLQNYYESNVIAGSVGGVASFTQFASTFGDLEISLTTKLKREISAGAAASNMTSPVPEPSSTALLGLAGMLLLTRRSR